MAFLTLTWLFVAVLFGILSKLPVGPGLRFAASMLSFGFGLAAFAFSLLWAVIAQI